jgi:hypothetical protein
MRNTYCPSAFHDQVVQRRQQVCQYHVGFICGEAWVNVEREQ